MPFRVKGRLYATDCRIVVSVPDSRKVKVSKGKPPKFGDIFVGFRVRKCTRPLPPMRADGHPAPGLWRSQKIGRHLFNAYYVAMIHASLTGVKYDPRIKPRCPMFFVADGGVRGAVMPLPPGTDPDELLGNPRGT